MDHHIVAQYAHFRATLDHTFEHHTTGDGAHLGNGEHLAHFNHAHDAFAFFGSQHAGQCSLDLIHHRVDDVVVADVHTGRFGQFARSCIGTRVEADHDRLGSQRKIDVRLGNRSHAAVDQIDFDFVGGQFLQRLRNRFGRALHVGFHDQRQDAHFAFGHLFEHVFQLGSLLFGELHAAILALTEQRNFTRAFFIRHHQQFLTGSGHF